MKPVIFNIYVVAGLTGTAQNSTDSAEKYNAKAAVEVQQGRNTVAYKYFQKL